MERASRSPRARRATSSSAQRLIRGWAIEIVLVAMLLPFLAAAVDLFARCRRRRIRIAPALRSYRSRLGFWAWVGAIFLFFSGDRPLGRQRRAPAGPGLRLVAGRSARRARRCSPAPAGSSPAAGSCPDRQIRPEERLAGHSAALLALGVVGLLRRGDESVRADLRPPLAARLALAAAGADSASGAARERACRGLRGACLPRVVVRHPLRAWLGCAVVHRQALRRRLRPAAAVRDRPRLARGGRPARRARRRTATRRTRRRANVRAAARSASSSARSSSRRGAAPRPPTRNARSTSSETEPAHGRAGRELAVSTWNVDERVRRGRAGRSCATPGR